MSPGPNIRSSRHERDSDLDATEKVVFIELKLSEYLMMGSRPCYGHNDHILGYMFLLRLHDAT
jgi:hypothetical protein